MEGIRALTLVDPLVLEDSSGAPFTATLRDGGRPSGVVLVHGIAGWRRMAELETVGRALSSGHDILSIDVRGHGDTPGRFTWGREEWRQVDAAVRYLSRDGRKVAVIGFSLGGYHAARAAANGAPVDRLILVGAPVDLWIFDHFPLGARFFRHVPAMLRRKRRVPRLTFCPRIGKNAIARDELSRIRAETLLIHGTADFLVTRRHAERYAAEIPRARLLDVEDGLHAEYLFHSRAETAPGVIGAIESFLAS